MQIKRYSMKDKDIYDKFLYNVNKNEPFIISKFLDDNINDIKYITNNKFKGTVIIKKNAPLCSYNNIYDFSKVSKDTYCRSLDKQCNNNSNKSLICYNNLLYKLYNNKRFIFNKIDKGCRIWNHSKGKFTRDHFDVPGLSTLNISVKGRKKWKLAKPNTFIRFPFNNISIYSNDLKYDFEIITNPGDLLYVPPFWHHSVLTLEDNTTNLSIDFYDYERKISNKDKAYLMIHKIFNTHSWNTSQNNKILNNENPFTFNTLKYFLLNFSQIFIILFCILYYFNLNTKYLYLILLLCFLLNTRNSAIETAGFSQIYFPLIQIIIILFIIIRNILNTNYKI